jgi:hypothetical protein
MMQFACSPMACQTFPPFPDGSFCKPVGMFPAPSVGLHSSGECLLQYTHAGHMIYMIGLPAGPEENPYAFVSVTVRGAPSPMDFSKHFTIGPRKRVPVEIDAVFQDENHLRMFYQTTFVKSVLAHASILLEGDEVIFIPRYAGSPNIPARSLLHSIQRRAIKGLHGCTYYIFSSQCGPKVQVHMADEKCFKQCLAVNGTWCGAEEGL